MLTRGSIYDVEVAVGGGNHSLQACRGCHGPGQQYGRHDPAPGAKWEPRQIVPGGPFHQVDCPRVGGKGKLEAAISVHVPKGGTLQQGPKDETLCSLACGLGGWGPGTVGHVWS